MKKFLLILCIILLTGCRLRISTISEEEQQQENIIKKQNDFNRFINMKVDDVWRYSYHFDIYRIYGGWVIKYENGFGKSFIFIPYDDIMKEYEK